MAFDPVQEDCLRLILRSMQRERIYPLENGPYVASRIEMFRENPDALIANDADRAFHLVARATELLDYRLPFVIEDAEADKIAAQAESVLEEASALDPGNWDAQRMLAALRLPSVEDYYRYLDETAPKVLASYTEAASRQEDTYEREYASDLARRPYLRWMASLASKALIAGHYTHALDVCEQSLRTAPGDPADIRFTAVLALAKLERREELERFRSEHFLAFMQRPRTDAWTLVARCALAYKEMDFDAARQALDEIIATYRDASRALYQQVEFPDGVFSRLNVQPGSTDELAIALSEATPLLQEGVGAPDNASLAAWVALYDGSAQEPDFAIRAPSASRRPRPEDEN